MKTKVVSVRVPLEMDVVIEEEILPYLKEATCGEVSTRAGAYRRILLRGIRACRSDKIARKRAGIEGRI